MVLGGPFGTSAELSSRADFGIYIGFSRVFEIRKAQAGIIIPNTIMESRPWLTPVVFFMENLLCHAKYVALIDLLF